MSELVNVTFQKASGSYNAGEKAGFEANVAAHYVENLKVARYTKPPKPESEKQAVPGRDKQAGKKSQTK